MDDHTTSTQAFLFGIVIFVLAFPAFFLHEGNAVHAARDLKEGERAIVSESANEGQLAQAPREVVTPETLSGPRMSAGKFVFAIVVAATLSFVAIVVGRRRRYLPHILAVFLLSRILYFQAGILFLVDVLWFGWHFLDPALLRTNLLQSIYYLHSQPPCFNLFLGLTLKAFPLSFAVAFRFAYLLLGATLAVSLHFLMTVLGVSEWLSAALTMLFIVSPSCIIYENWLFYTYPLATVICLSGLFLYHFLRKGKWIYGALFFSSLSVVVLTRSVFHLFWLLGLVVLVWQRGDRRRVLAVSCVPLLLATAWYVKNAMLFGSFSSSTWLGMNLARITISRLSSDDLKALVKEGKLGELSLIPTFSPIRDYRPYISMPRATGIAALDEEAKSHGGDNFNHLAYIDISRGYLRDAVRVIRMRPQAYLKSVLTAYYVYCLPASQFAFTESNRRVISRFERVYSVAVYGQLQRSSWGAMKVMRESGEYARFALNTGLFLAIGIPALTLWACAFGLRCLSGEDKCIAAGVTVLFVALNIGYVTLVVNCIELGENNRYRFMIEPLLVVLLGLFLERTGSYLRAVSGRSSDTEGSRRRWFWLRRLPP